MKYTLPYINNAKAVLITVTINLAILFIFNWPGGINMKGVMVDSAICACITTLIDIWIVYTCMKKMREDGQLPQYAPVSCIMQRLPKNPFALGTIFALFFVAITMGINWSILSFFEMNSMTFTHWLIYKLIYTTVLSIKIVEFCIFRFVQPDWANSKQGKTNEETLSQPVKNPFPGISLYKELFGGVTFNLVMNIIMGSIFGSVIIQSDGSILLLTTTIEGIPITGLIFGFIIGVLITYKVVKSLKTTILTVGPPILESAGMNKWVTWMPMRTGALMFLITIIVMIFSAVALPSIMYLLGKSSLNFLQFTIFITLYATLIGKPISYVLIRRCLQKDYINRIMSTT